MLTLEAPDPGDLKDTEGLWLNSMRLEACVEKLRVLWHAVTIYIEKCSTGHYRTASCYTRKLSISHAKYFTCGIETQMLEPKKCSAEGK